MEHAKRARAIIHLDMDAFYPAVEVLDNPSLKGKPVIVGGSRERGVVSSASYEARPYGVHSAMPMAQAIRLCPRGIVLPVRMWRYRQVSEQVLAIFHRFTPLVEPLSIDEAFLDVTESVALFGDPREMARRIKAAVLQETGLTVSAGVAPSKFVAKIASDRDKPDGLTVVHPDRVQAFLDPLPAGKMWGAGKVTQKALAELAIHTFRDLRECPVEILEKAFGRHGLQMRVLSMGLDEREVTPEHTVKSIGHEETFARDIPDLATAERELLGLAERVAHRMRQKDLQGRTLTLKVKYSDFVLRTRSTTLEKHTDDAREIYAAARTLLKGTRVGKKPVRLLGIALSHLLGQDTEDQLALFEDGPGRRKKALHKALDSIHERFGDRGIRPGGLIEKGKGQDL